jgi:hypothetical protein
MSVLDEWLNSVMRELSTHDAEVAGQTPIRSDAPGMELQDLVVADATLPHNPRDIFARLRWGGVMVFVTPTKTEAAAAVEEFKAAGFEVDGDVQIARQRLRWLPIFHRRARYVAARKLQLIMPGEITDRFTHHVYLQRPGPGLPHVVAKEVPSTEMVHNRLRARWPELSDDVIEKRARKFTEKIFPIFLTREAAILKIVHRDLPAEYRARVPKLLSTEKDDRGYVRKLTMTWLRNGGQPLRQSEFARQSADLLRMLHGCTGVMHLDLRLDNFVITENGVGFVDFGSAVRDNEDLKENPLLDGLFEELMRTSEIQRMLGRMSTSGQVTSNAITRGLHRVDRAVDVFYLAVQISAPHTNPELRGLIQYDPQSEEARKLARLTEQVLRPADPARPAYCSAVDILHGIEEIQQSMGIARAPAPAARTAAPARAAS